jgi:hypothetical protein
MQVKKSMDRWDFEGDETDIAGDRVLHVAARLLNPKP